MKNKNDILRENQSHSQGSRIRKMENSKKKIFCSLDMYCFLDSAAARLWG